MARSISPQELIGWWKEDLDPRKHITAKRRSEKLSLHLSQFMVLLYGLLCLSAINEAILLYTTFAVAPMPPAAEKTKGRERSMFHFSNPFIVCSSLLKLVSAVALGERGVAIARCEWVKNPYIKKCTLPITSPEILSYNVNAGSIFTVC